MKPAGRLSYAWVVVGLLWVVAVLNYLDRQLLTSMSKPIELDLQIEHAKFGLFSSVFLWTYGVLSPFAGYIADRFGRRNVIIASLLVWSMVTWLTAHVHSFEQMLIARALMGISEAFYIPAAVALIVDYHQGSTRSRATGLHLSGAYAGSILGGMGGWLAADFGWRFGFNLFGLLGVAYVFFLMLFLRNAPQAEADSPSMNPAPVRLFESLGTLLVRRSFLVLLLMNALVGASFWTIKNWLPTFINLEMGLDLARAGIYGMAFFNGAAFIGMLAAGFLADSWSRKNPRARALVPAIGFCIAAPCFFVVGITEQVAVMLMAVAIVGMAQGGLDANLMPTLCSVAESRYRATGYGMLNFVGTMTGGLMTYVGGILKDAQVPFATTFQAVSILIFIAGLLLFTVKAVNIRTE